jgi:hypothetical protein
MRSRITSRYCATLILLLATAPAATLALPSDAPDPSAPQRADAPPIPTVWEQPATPAPVIIVPTPEPQLDAPQRTLSPNPLWEIPLVKLSTTRERPIFSPSRRPPAVVIAAPSTPPAPPPPKLPRVERPQLSLVGTVSGDDERFGIFVDQTTKTALRLRIGEDYQGWKLRAVQGREVTLEYEQQSAILTLPQPGTTPGQHSLRPLIDSASAQSQAPLRRD